jgi:16S rRNA (adenine1518-N6/adenine1519-N6)-dimethyltransferase
VSLAGDPLGAQGSRRPPWSAFRAALEEVGFRPTKALGQNFLVDPNAARSIAEDAGLANGAHVLEIGAGCGFLTLHLCELGFEVLAVEIDTRLLAVAQRVLGERAGLRWLRLDVLAGKHELAPELVAALPPKSPWHLVSNLPYSVAAPVLVLLARLQNPPRSMTVLVQDELAQRVAAEPGEPEWGALAARLRLHYGARAGRSVGAQLFWPRPRVASRVLHLDWAPVEGLRPSAIAPFDRLVEVLFQQRRKQVGTTLAGFLGDRARATALLAEGGVEPQVRAEVLSLAALLALARSPLWITGPDRPPKA